MFIKAQNLSKEFKTKKKGNNYVRAVDNVNFEIEKSEIVAFIGPNGAGKSTTIKMLTGIIQPTSGNIEVAGLDPTKDRKKLGYKIGCMFGQKSQLYMHLSVRDSYILLGSIYDMPKKQVLERIDEIAKEFKIEHLLDTNVRKLSLGQRMICEIAGSIIHDPEIIFLDEPTIGLDVIAKLRIREIIKKLNKKNGTTIFLTSHDIGDVEALCDRIIVINKGSVVKDSTTEELKSQYLSTKQIEFIYEENVEKNEFDFPITSKYENKISLNVDSSEQNMGEVLMYFSRLGTLCDVQISSISMEEVIKKIYEEEKKG